MVAMSTKLTLSIEAHVIEKAKKYAKAKGVSLSHLIENYLMSLTKDTSNRVEEPLTPLTQSLRGSFQAPDDFDENKALLKSLEGKKDKK